MFHVKKVYHEIATCNKNNKVLPINCLAFVVSVVD